MSDKRSWQPVAFGWRSAESTAAHAYILPAIKYLLPEGPRLTILDVGCGNRYIASRLSAMGHTVIGIITNRELPSTRVATWVLREPAKRSPSQCPGSARSSASGGRSRMEMASLICPRGCPLLEPRPDLRIIGLERRWASSSLLRAPLACTNRVR